MRTRQPVIQYMTSSLNFKFGLLFLRVLWKLVYALPFFYGLPNLSNAVARLCSIATGPYARLGTWAKTARQPSPRCAQARTLDSDAAQPYCPSLCGTLLLAKDSLRLVRKLDSDCPPMVLTLLRQMQCQYALIQFGADMLTVT